MSSSVKSLTADAFKRFADNLNEHAGRVDPMGKPLRLYDYQIESGFAAIESILKKSAREIFWCFSRQSGKTELAAAVVTFCAIVPALMKDEWFSNRGIMMAIFGAKAEQAGFIYDRTVEMVNSGYLEMLCPGLVIDVRATKIYITMNRGGRKFKSIIWRSTASGKAKIEGHTLDVAFMDEAQDTPDSRLKKSIGPMMSTTRGSRVYLGSFTDENFGYFMRMVIELEIAGNTVRRALFKFDWTHPARYNVYYKEYVLGEIEAYGEDDPYIQTQYFLNFNRESTVRFVTDPDAFMELRHGPFEYRSKEAVVIGIDPAREKDYSVATVVRVRDNRILNWWARQGTDYDQQELQLREFMVPYNVVAVFIEQNNAGVAVYDYLNKDCRVPGYKNVTGKCSLFWSNPKNKAAIYMEVLKLINEKGFSFPDGEHEHVQRFTRQFLELRKVYKNGVMKVDHPTERDAHNDYPDSFAIAMAAVKKAGLYQSYAKFAAREKKQVYTSNRPDRHFGRRSTSVPFEIEA